MDLRRKEKVSDEKLTLIHENKIEEINQEYIRNLETFEKEKSNTANDSDQKNIMIADLEKKIDNNQRISDENLKKVLHNYDQESVHKNDTINKLKKEIEDLNAFNVKLSGEIEELRNKEEEPKESTDKLQVKNVIDFEEMLKVKETELKKMKEELNRNIKNDIDKNKLMEKHQKKILDLEEKMKDKDYK